MKASAVVLACLLLAACDYTVPLTSNPDMTIDPALVGRWEEVTQSNNTNSLLVLPLNATEYMVMYPVDEDDGMFAKACLIRCGGNTLVQLDWFGTAAASLPDDARVYQFATYEIRGDRLTVRMMNTSVISKDIATTADLAAAIEAEAENEDLFDQASEFRKVSGK